MTTTETTLPLIDPVRFRTALEKTLDGLFELAVLTSTTKDLDDACWFSLSGDRPWPLEWLQSLQDLLQVPLAGVPEHGCVRFCGADAGGAEGG